MAELQSAEQKLAAITETYERVRCDEKLRDQLPLVKNITYDASTEREGANHNQSYTDLLSQLKKMRGEMEALVPSIERFRKRMAEKDPVTSKPRYGEKTQTRVTNLLALFDELGQILGGLFGDSTAAGQNASTDTATLKLLQDRADQEQAEAQEQAKLLAKKEKELQDRTAKEEHDRLEEERRAQEEAELAEQRRLQELRRQQEEDREAERRARVESQRADRAWVDSIAKGPDGVREQLAILLEGTKDDMEAQGVAVQALHMIFSQICSHPEEPNFRRVRRDHPRFASDIARHKGGKEMLIAAGFELGEIDGVPSFISKEPDLETDMDRWSAWFDLLKTTLNILEEQMKRK